MYEEVPDGWQQFGTAAADSCKDLLIEFSKELGDDYLPLWERVVHIPGIDAVLEAEERHYQEYIRRTTGLTLR